MEENFLLTCESTIDLPYSYTESRDIPVIFNTYTIDGKHFEDDMLRNTKALQKFYKYVELGMEPVATPINVSCYEDFFENQLLKGDILHISVGSGMFTSVDNAKQASERLMARYPGRRIVVIDSLCDSSGYGMLVDYAADMRDRGHTLEKTRETILDKCEKIHHQFFTSNLSYYRKSGDLFGTACAAKKPVFNNYTLLRLDDRGRMVAYSKLRGKSNAIEKTIEAMELHAEGGISYNGKCFICHSECKEDAEALKKAVTERFPFINGDIQIFNMGMVTAAHCGPGTVAVFFFGDKRICYDI